MVNFREPAVALQDFAVLKNFWHAINGLYIWEFFTTLDYEWNILRGRRPYRWTIWIYSLTRVTTLVAVILNFVDLDATTRIDCQVGSACRVQVITILIRMCHDLEVWITFELIFSYLGVAAASLLIVLRVYVAYLPVPNPALIEASSIAIWNRNKIVVAIATGVWAVNVAVIIQGKSHPTDDHQCLLTLDLLPGIVRLRSIWSESLRTCLVLNSEINKANITVTLITDVVLLLTVLAGLIGLRRLGGGAFGIGRILWNQGVIWLLLATIAEVPPTIFIYLDLNGAVYSFPVFYMRVSRLTPVLKITDPFNLMFQFPGLITLAIAATRMYRSLTDFVSGSTNMCDSLPLPSSAFRFSRSSMTLISVSQSVQGHEIKPPNAKRNSPAPIPSTRIEVSVDTAYEQFPTSQTSHHGLCTGNVTSGEQPGDKPDGLSPAIDLEAAVWTDCEGRKHNLCRSGLVAYSTERLSSLPHQADPISS
ncbi:hypothetical protein F5148DRAFT_1289011 [Russula earlei]|uniref:Uncharacterized protein n=1 Tax=Russula earlei TaxID=71964 RepID=A0ACC0TYB7_9AGAM|nr:hypothetical protein F5148DRAFT_1289011 [Russula earlei]